MHIGFVAHNFIRGNGQGRINFETAIYAARQGHHVTLLANRVDAQLAATPNVDWEYVAQKPERPNLLGVRSFAVSADRQVQRKRHTFDVVVGAGYTLAEPHDVNLCQFVHGAWLHSPVHVAKLARGPWAWYQFFYTRFNVRWERRAYGGARIVVAPSEKIKSELIGIGVPADQVAVIYNGVDIEEFHPRSPDNSVADERVALGLPPTGCLALFVGDIRTTRKNLDSVLKALREIPAVHLVVVGAVERSPFPALARELGVADRVTFTDFQREVPRYMRAADFFVFPSRYEAGTLVLTEAAASGLPLVTAASAGGAEVFGPEVAEIISNPDDLPALVKAMRRFSDSPPERGRAAVAARAAAERLTWTRMAQNYLDLFEKCASTKIDIGKKVGGISRVASESVA